MLLKTHGSFNDRWAFRLICAAAFAVAFSLPAGRTMLVLSLVLLLIDCIRNQHAPIFPAVAWCWLAFAGIALLTSLCGVNPSHSLKQLDKLLWFLAIPISATLIQDWKRVRTLLIAFAAGCSALSLEILVWRPIAARIACRTIAAAGETTSYRWQLTDLGSMTDGQVLMLGIVAILGLVFGHIAQHGRSPKRLALAALALAIPAAALILNFKRGSILVTFILVAGFVATRMRFRYLLILFTIVLGILCLPPVWDRFSSLHAEMDTSRGGRLVMWTRIAPSLIREHPFGIGYRGLTAEMMQNVAAAENVYVEPARNHLHSNPLQILVATGWIGLFVYLIWMIIGLRNAWHLVRHTANAPPPHQTMALSLLLMLTGIILNGLIEYNFADGELVLLYGILLGMIGGLAGGETNLNRKAWTAFSLHNLSP